MSVEPKQPFGPFLFAVIRETRRENPAGVSEKMWLEAFERAHAFWHEVRKAKRKPKPGTDAEWILSLKADPALEGVDVDKELAKCAFWCRNQTPAVKMSRRRAVNWLNRAERTVTVQREADPLGEVPGWLAFMQDNYPDWVRLKDGQVPTWARLSADERRQVIELMGAFRP